jgi:hypothetical protein
LALTVQVQASGIFTKTEYEEFHRYHDFANWLQAGETLASTTVKCYVKSSGVDASTAMITNVDVGTTKALYRIKAGTADTMYIIKIKVVTTTGQKFEDWVECKVI